jgi:hypothetical protein
MNYPFCSLTRNRIEFSLPIEAELHLPAFRGRITSPMVIAAQAYFIIASEPRPSSPIRRHFKQAIRDGLDNFCLSLLERVTHQDVKHARRDHFAV